MTGQNRFGTTTIKSWKGSSEGQTCIFISHRKLDRDAALVIANHLKNLNVDIYIDEYDRLLSAATTVGDTAKIVEYIENGILTSTHLLGIVSPNTKGSWWVPFEIGSARQKNLSIAYLLLDNVDYLPEYLQITKQIKDQFELKDWIINEIGGTTIALKSADPSRLAIPRLPRIRSKSPTFLKS